MDFDLEKLKQEQEDAQNKKALYSTIGTIAQGFADVPSSYELLKGKSMGPKSNAKGVMDTLAAGVQDPLEKQMKTFQAYKSAKEAQQFKELEDPNSPQVKSAKMMLISKGVDPSQLEGMNFRQLVAIHGDPGKLAEIQAQAVTTFENQKKLKEIDHRNDMAKLGATKKEGAKLPSGEAANLAKSDDALQDVLNFGQSAEAMNFDPNYGKLNPMRYVKGTDDNTSIQTFDNQKKAMMQKIGTYLEGGKLTDVDFESKYLPMAPNFDDPPALKKAKLANLEKMVKQRMNSEIDSYGKAGYNVGNFNKAEAIPGNPLAKKPTQGAANTANAAQITPDVLSYAQKHGISPEQALQIKLKRGGQ
jgi:hypothetical protein